MRKMTKKKNGFTLIELLVVIAIIALLLSILLPALKKAKNLARDSICMNNLKQVGVAMTSYANNYNQKIPRNAGATYGPEFDQPIWVIAFLPYLGTPVSNINEYYKVAIYDCPMHPNKEQTIDYVVNSWGAAGTENEHKGVSKLTDIANLGSKIYLVDHEYIINPSSTDPLQPAYTKIYRNFNDLNSWRAALDFHKKEWIPGTTEGANNNARRVAKARHKQKGSNAMYFDGHSGFVEAKDLTPDKFYTTSN
jgi:prepilin-type N-terminal cleavage/methylation domain-containing protein/prepilin-type processing-associated H-X9-DG protein